MPGGADDDVVLRAETYVHQVWVRRIRQRLREVEDAVRRADARRESARRRLVSARHGNDPEGISEAQTELEEATRAIAKIALAWEVLNEAVALESAAGDPPSEADDS